MDNPKKTDNIGPGHRMKTHKAKKRKYNTTQN